MELSEIANLDEIKKALRDKYLKEELGAVQTGHITLDDLKNQSDDDLRGSWIDWYSDPMFGGLSPDDFEEGSYDKDTILKILNDKGTMPTKDEIVKYVSDNIDKDEEPKSKNNAISRDELYNMIQKWRNGSSEANSKSSKLQEAYLEYLDSILEKEGYDTFATDPDTGEELDDYTPEFEATQAEVMNDLGLGDDDIDLIFNGKGDFSDFETEYDNNGLPVKQSDKSHDSTNLGGIAKSITQNDLGRSL